MRAALAGLLAGCAIAGTLAGLEMVPRGPVPAAIAPGATLPACATEDGSYGPLPCVWDAARRGNAAGDSYWLDAQMGPHYFRP